MERKVTITFSASESLLRELLTAQAEHEGVIINTGAGRFFVDLERVDSEVNA